MDVQDEVNSGFFLIVWQTRLELLWDRTIYLLKRGFHPPLPLTNLNTPLLPSKEQPIFDVGGNQGVYLTTQHSRDRHPCRRLELNPQSQAASGRRPVPLDRAATRIGC